MNVIGRRVAVLLVLVCLLSAFAASENAKAQDSRHISLSEFRIELERIQADTVQMSADPAYAVDLFKSIPDQYRLKVVDREILVDNTPLKLAIGEYKIGNADRRERLLLAIKSRLNDLHEGTAQFEAKPTDIRAKLDDVLSRPRFQGAHGPSIVEVWWHKVQDWAARYLAKLFGKLPSTSPRSDKLAWVLIAVALCILVIWIKRIAGRREPEIVRVPIPFAPSAKGWRTWLAEARAAAAENRWRDAVHLAYWAGISNLEERDAWVPDRARTPREYLQLISASHPGKQDLAALTRRFELTWYGKAEGSAADFDAALRHLEVLGCR